MLRRLVTMLGLSLLAACTQAADIEGSALLRTQGGEVRTCGGSQVYIASTGAGGQFIENLFAAEIKYQRESEYYLRSFEGASWNGTNGYMPYISELNSRSVSDEFEEFNLTAAEKDKIGAALCDLQGNFSFSGLSAGEYYVAGAVFWMVGDEGQGGLMVKKVQVDAGETATVQLTP